jgi:hypothetical protein
LPSVISYAKRTVRHKCNRCASVHARVITPDNFCRFDQTWRVEVTGTAASGIGVAVALTEILLSGNSALQGGRN